MQKRSKMNKLLKILHFQILMIWLTFKFLFMVEKVHDISSLMVENFNKCCLYFIILIVNLLFVLAKFEFTLYAACYDVFQLKIELFEKGIKRTTEKHWLNIKLLRPKVNER